jgi:DNA-binding NtrC family response regulator
MTANACAQLREFEGTIGKHWSKTRCNKTAAAKVLGMSFRALRHRIKELGIEWRFRDSEHNSAPRNM